MLMNSKKSGTNMHTALQTNNILFKITSADKGLNRNEDTD